MSHIQDEYISFVKERYEDFNTHILLVNSNRHISIHLNTAVPILNIATTIILEDPNLMPPDESLIKWAIGNGFATGHADTRGDLLSEISAQIKELRGL